MPRKRRPRKRTLQPPREDINSMKKFIRSQRGSMKRRPAEPSALDLLLAERRGDQARGK